MSRNLKLLVAMVVVSSVTFANPPQNFGPGSLIIPVEATFQTQCGTTSAYGLVWKILYENRSGGAFSGNPVTIYWAIEGTKASPNRCVPTNLHQPPTSGSALTWNDGCDFTITNPTQQPVVMVNYGSGPPTAPSTYANGAVTHFTTSTSTSRPHFDNTAATASKGYSPGASALTTTSPTATFTTIRYMGGAFVIDANDAKRVIDAMRSSSYPHLNQHTVTPTSCTTGVNCCSNIGTSSVTQRAYKVLMHQATTTFNAPVYKRINKVPPKIALLDYGAGVKTVLQKYLDAAALTGNIAGQPVGGTPASGTSGLVYDRLRAIDDLISTPTYPDGYLNSNDPATGKSRYKVFWAPHWKVQNSSQLFNHTTCSSSCLGDPGHDGKCSSGGSGNSGGSAACDATTAEITNALENIAVFTNQKGNGLMAQCQSIGGLESAHEWGSSSWSTFAPFYTNSTHFHFTDEIEVNGLGDYSTTWSGKNCTDPDYAGASGGECTRFMAPEDPFAQVGDFPYKNADGAIAHFRPYLSASARRTGVRRLAFSWNNWTSSSTTEGVSTSSGLDPTYNKNGNDFITIGQKDNDPNKATIIYVSAHDLSNTVAGTRVILNTLLNLGADPQPSGRSMAQAVGFSDVTNGNAATFVSSVFTVWTGTMLPGATTFNKANGKNWLFPLTRGAIRGRDADSLNVGVNELDDSIFWDSEVQMPLPADRNLFTYFGGVVEESPSLSGSRVVKNDVIQHRWVPARFEHTNINDNFGSSPNSQCTDVLEYGDYVSKFGGANTAGLVRGHDGICDLQQALQMTSFGWVTGGSGNHTIPPGHLTQMAADALDAQHFVQLVRGYCFSLDGSNNPRLTPSDADCKPLESQDNRAHFGGPVHSSAAVVPPTGKVLDSGAPRPTVAYVGTWDGQLHAVWVGGGAGYTGPAGGRNYVDFSTGTNSSFSLVGGPSATHPAQTFKTNWAQKFAAGSVPLQRGTELWSFIPPSQIPLLRSNAARVDSTPVARDVFVDLDGDGVRSWHTVLVVSLGGTSSEVFAIDVTNPLQPVLLWDIVGANTTTLPFLAAGGYDWNRRGNAKPLEWDNKLTDYQLPPEAAVGRTVGYPYDLGDTGGARALAVGEMREGLEPVYAVFLASNSSGLASSNPAATSAPAAGLLVTALDIGSGQKLWSWRQEYEPSSSSSYRSAINGVPSPATVHQQGDGTSVVYAGDLEGRLWELNAATGVSTTALKELTCTPSTCNFPAFDTKGTQAAPEPITSNIALARVPQGATGTFGSYNNQNIVLFATRGTNWVPTSLGGQLYGVLLDSTRRKPVAVGGVHLDGSAWSAGDARNSALGTMSSEYGGVLQVPPTGMPLPFTAPDRVYGNISVLGQMVYVPIVTPPAAGGQFDDPLVVDKSLGGKTFEYDLGLMATSPGSPMASFSYANFGGIAAFVSESGGVTSGHIISDQVHKTSKKGIPAAATSSSPYAPKQSLSTEQALPYRLYNVVRRFFSQQ